jgi:hypothetical protein
VGYKNPSYVTWSGADSLTLVGGCSTYHFNTVLNNVNGRPNHAPICKALDGSYVKLGNGENCTNEMKIDNLEECKLANKEVGVQPVYVTWGGSDGQLPGGCSSVHFNTALGTINSRNDVTPLCKAAYDEFIGGCCGGKNELGNLISCSGHNTRQECLDACITECNGRSNCVSFEMHPQVNPTGCFFSTSCTSNERLTLDCGHDLYIKPSASTENSVASSIVDTSSHQSTIYTFKHGCLLGAALTVWAVYLYNSKKKVEERKPLLFDELEI